MLRVVHRQRRNYEGRFSFPAVATRHLLHLLCSRVTLPFTNRNKKEQSRLIKLSMRQEKEILRHKPHTLSDPKRGRQHNKQEHIRLITYSITEPDTSPNPTKRLGGTNLCYASLISSLLNKEPMYNVLTTNLEDISVSFLHVRALCLVPLQFL
jgi:hypothetical protein